MPDGLIVILRPFDPETDSAFLYSSWRNSNWYADPTREEPSSEFYSQETRRIKNLLKHPDTDIQVACLKEDPDLIVGYAVKQAAHLEFIYVKQDYRSKGIGRLLAKGCQSFGEPTTPAARAIVKKKNLKLTENQDGKTEETEDCCGTSTRMETADTGRSPDRP